MTEQTIQAKQPPKENKMGYMPVKKLLFTKEFSYIILLDNYTYKPEIIDATEVYGEIFGTYGNCFVNNRFGHLNF